MNDQIRKLAFKAMNDMPSYDEFGMIMNEEEMVKFAQLIVRECYNVAETHDCNLSGNGGEILKHFGVE